MFYQDKSGNPDIRDNSSEVGYVNVTLREEQRCEEFQFLCQAKTSGDVKSIFQTFKKNLITV
jgi:hypothetical protein